MSDEPPTIPPDEQALVDAATADDVDAVRRLLGSGVSADARGAQKHMTWEHTALMFAAERGHADVVHELLAAGANVAAANVGNKVDGGGGSQALHFAAAGGYIDVITLLLDAGADPNVHGRYGRTPLTEAIFTGHADAVRLLLSRGANVKLKAKRKDYEAPAFAAASTRNVEVLRIILAAGADPNGAGGRATPALHRVTIGDDVEDDARIAMMTALIEAGATVDGPDRDGGTALQTAVAYNNARAVKVLLEAGANPNQLLAGQPLAARAKQYDERSAEALQSDVSRMSAENARTFRAVHEMRRRHAQAIMKMLEPAAAPSAAAKQGTR
jgi:ankyrin repeat protein